MAIVLESIAVSGNYPGEVTLPTGIVAGDLLLALAYWGSAALEPIDGFTIIESAGADYDWFVLQYRIADGSESSPIVPDPDWVVYETVVARISGHDAADPINAFGVPERVSGAGSTSKTVEIDSISPDIADAALVTLASGSVGQVPTGLTVEGVAFDLSDIQSTYAGGVNLELLGASGATGTRTAVVSTSGNASYSILGALVALNPAAGPISYDLSGTVAGTSTVAGNATLAATLSGSIAGTSTVAGDTTLAIDVSGTVAGTSTVTGNTTLAIDVSGSVAGTSAVVGNLSSVMTLSGSIAGTSTVSGNVAVMIALSASVAGTSFVDTATPKQAIDLAGTVAGTSTITAPGVDALFTIAGSVAGSSTVIGDVTFLTNITMQARTVAEAYLQGRIETTAELTGRMEIM